MRITAPVVIDSFDKSSCNQDRVGVTVLDNSNDFFEPRSGIIAVPAPKDALNYNYAEMLKYCRKVDKKLKELDKDERKMFELPND
ncbi:hypothetical protein MOF32_27040 [Priestia megaterium]|uniref:hypothetical protein n=1 Tax=Priestia megaterium TaxID=1404 RepID=UPI00227DFB76|nr:hypothetical protein [Priestia megaterium]MCY9026542.1 hypothetical protein [Priestia megaterium]